MARVILEYGVGEFAAASARHCVVVARHSICSTRGHCFECDTGDTIHIVMQKNRPNQTLQATAVKRLGWQVGYQQPAVPELVVGPHEAYAL